MLKILKESDISLIFGIIYLFIVFLFYIIDYTHDSDVYIFLMGFFLSNGFHAFFDWWQAGK